MKRVQETNVDLDLNLPPPKVIRTTNDSPNASRVIDLNTPPPPPKKPSKKSKHGKRVSRFVFTLNNYTQDEYEAIKTIDCRWMIVGKEVGEEGTPHLQGACFLRTQKAFSRLKTLPGLKRAHVEEARGSAEQQLAYCTKQDKDAYISGTMPQPGKRSDLEDVVDKLRSGTSLSELAETNSSAIPMLRYTRGITFLRSIYSPNRDVAKPPTIFWFYGPTGTGKTRTAYELSNHIQGIGYEMPWMSSGSLRWFDGYDGNRVAIFDDLRTKHAEFSFLLRLLDRYPLKVEVKGGHVNWNPGFIFITAPYSPEQMWNLKTREQLDQLTRRITQSVEFPIEFDIYESLFGMCRGDRLGASDSYAKLRTELDADSGVQDLFKLIDGNADSGFKSPRPSIGLHSEDNSQISGSELSAREAAEKETCSSSGL